MDQKELRQLLNKLTAQPKETEWIEFKEASLSFHFDKLGKYFSALSNEANLKGKDYGWLVFGITDKDRKVVGTQFRHDRTKLDSLKEEIANHTTNRITFMEIHELSLPEGRVIMFQIPAAPKGIPVSWKGHYYGREGESKNALSLQEIEQIRNQVKREDWSAQICGDATIDDLDPAAISKAREEYRREHPRLVDVVDNWNYVTFLNKAKVTIRGKITNSAIVLLGKEYSEHFLSPSIAKISWILKDEHNTEKTHEHFGPPFILNVEQLFSKVRNLKYRYLPDGTLFPIEVYQYDSWVVREALHNCIAHQDYELRGRINVIEKPDELIFSNLGTFIPGSVEAVIQQDAPQEYYRNRFLVDAMVNFNMIETIGSGIKKMFQTQVRRFFPLPDYDLTQPERVIVRIQGKVLNENYTRLLIRNPDMNLATVMLLDKVQKQIRLSKDDHRFLKSRELVEGRYPNLFVSSRIAVATGEKAKYIKYRGFDKKYYQDLIIEFIKKNSSASRREIDELLLNKLPEILTEPQKKKRVGNMLNEMSTKLGLISNTGGRKYPRWTLVSK